MVQDDDNSVILVDLKDNIIGYESKITAHQQGLLRRAFIIQIYNDNGELLLQQRSLNKYCEPGLWDIGCGGYAVPGENIQLSAIKRAQVELGITTEMIKISDGYYDQPSVDLEITTEMIKVSDGYYDKASENNSDGQWYFHFFRSFYNGNIYPDPNEIIDYKWMHPDDIFSDVMKNQSLYTGWAFNFMKKYRTLLFNIKY